jgi:VWFA-related protein
MTTGRPRTWKPGIAKAIGLALGKQAPAEGALFMAGLTIVLIFVLMVPAGRAGYQAPVTRGPGQGSFQISVDVALVVLQATVTDRQGDLVTDLGEQDFEVYENGVPQRIQLFKNEDVPVAVGLVIDHSTSMGPKMADVIAASRAFVRSSNREDEMFVVNFNEAASLGLPSAVRFTDHTMELERAILVKLTGGQTALYDAIAMGLDHLQAAARDKKVLIAISDGGDNASRRKLDDVMKLAERSTAAIYTVGVFEEDDPDKNPDVLKRLARATGGEAFLPREPGEVVAICERIARDIRHQYIIGYVPIKSHDGTYRTIRVLARPKGQSKLTVRTRTGYIAGGEPRLSEQGAK